MKKTERPKNRYISFQASPEIPNVEDFLYKEFMKFFGEFGFSKISFKVLEYDRNKNYGIIRCNRDYVEKVRGFFALLNPRIKSLRTSGTIKTLRELKPTS